MKVNVKDISIECYIKINGRRLFISSNGNVVNIDGAPVVGEFSNTVEGDITGYDVIILIDFLRNLADFLERDLEKKLKEKENKE